MRTFLYAPAAAAHPCIRTSAYGRLIVAETSPTAQLMCYRRIGGCCSCGARPYMSVCPHSHSFNHNIYSWGDVKKLGQQSRPAVAQTAIHARRASPASLRVTRQPPKVSQTGGFPSPCLHSSDHCSVGIDLCPGPATAQRTTLLRPARPVERDYRELQRMDSHGQCP